jgi:hypothetical protein
MTFLIPATAKIATNLQHSGKAGAGDGCLAAGR